MKNEDRFQDRCLGARARYAGSMGSKRREGVSVAGDAGNRGLRKARRNLSQVKFSKRKPMSNAARIDGAWGSVEDRAKRGPNGKRKWRPRVRWPRASESAEFPGNGGRATIFHGAEGGESEEKTKSDRCIGRTLPDKYSRGSADNWRGCRPARKKNYVGSVTQWRRRKVGTKGDLFVRRW